ncbi:TonB-dependent receptor [Pedobacter deserti]|uniref:TonB-dependent receptor n=1 Tax=Pedobacter deserti TaxID=2817382 RepID=UPI00210BDD1E|nr:TonB-dependent receptor [Pedobacter sp. SYSU D00382]
MIKIIFTVLFSLFSLQVAFCQAVIRGSIEDELGRPLPGINISLNADRRGTTDAAGKFIFENLAPGEYMLIATGVGYQATKQGIVLRDGQHLSLRLVLNISSSTLTEVVIRGQAQRQTGSLTRGPVLLKDIPQQVQLVERELINDQQLFQLNDAFKNVAGFTSTDFYGSFSSRGYTSGIGGITTNGIKGSPYPEGQLPLLGNVERVEVIRGPSAILYGQGGMGGNVNLVTKQPKRESTLNASAAGGSFDLYRMQADVTSSLTRSKNLYFLFGGGFQDGGSFTDGFDRRSIQAYGSLKWDIAPKTSWQINANYIHDDASNNYQPRVPIYNSLKPDSIFLAPHTFNPGYNSFYKGNNLQLQSVMEHAFSERVSVGVLAAFNQSRTVREQYTAAGYIRTADQTVMRSYTYQKINSPGTTVNLYTNVKQKIWVMTHQLSVGADAVLNKNKYPEGIRQYAADPINVYDPVKNEVFDSVGKQVYTNSQMERFTYNTLGAYIQDHIEIGRQWKVLAGLRYNNYFRRYLAVDPERVTLYNERPERTENFSPRLGVVYQPLAVLSVYADYNQGFSPHYSNYSENGGPFDPETSKQLELGFKGDFLQGRLLPFVSLYQSTRRNVLQVVPRPGLPRWQEAIGAVRSRGIEAGVSGSVTQALFINVNYTFNKTRITEAVKPEDIGQRFANTPEHTANAWLRYVLPPSLVKGLYVGGGFQHVGRRFFSNQKVGRTVAEMPAYTIFDAMIGYRYENYRLQVNGNNLFDKRYAMSGIANSYTPGMPRNILVGISYEIR